MNFYKECATILSRLEEKKGSIKSLVGSLPEKDRKRAAALVIETLKYQPILVEITEASGLRREERKFLHDKHLVTLLVHDLLFSKGIQMGDGPVKQAVLKHKTRLKAELVKAQIKRQVSKKEELAQSPENDASISRRWVRINTLRASEAEVLTAFRRIGFKEIDPKEDLKQIEESTMHFSKDLHIPSLLSFSSGVRLQDSSLVTEGKIILQDKASCFPAFILDPPSVENTHVIDATAAPGNKTSHLSALMRGKGRITAFERDRRRFKTLEMMLKRAGATNVVAKNEDFLAVDPLDVEYANVSHILLDPSCSGSGIVNRLDFLTPQEDDAVQSQERLDKLAGFQLKILRHALKFPKLKRIVYSTCSIHDTENEDVVIRALNEQEKPSTFQIADKASVIPSWPRRGNLFEGYETTSFIRCLPEDGMNGFFVACLERRMDGLKRKVDVLMENSAEEGGITPKKRRRKKRKQDSEHRLIVPADNNDAT